MGFVLGSNYLASPLGQPEWPFYLVILFSILLDHPEWPFYLVILFSILLGHPA